MNPEHDRIVAGVERRLAAVEGLIAPPLPWRGAGEPDHLADGVVVVPGSAMGPRTQRRVSFGVLLAAALMVAAALVLAVLGGLGTMTRERGWRDLYPVQTATTFARPFTFAIDPSSGIERNDVSRSLVQFRIASQTEPGRFNRIVAVRVADVVRADPCLSGGGGTVEITSPAQFVEYLQSVSGLAASEPTGSTVDGRQALQVTVRQSEDPSCPSVWIWPHEEAFTSTAAARRIQAFEVDGVSVLVVAAVAEAQDLEAWLAIADQFIATLRFTAESTRSESASP